MARAGRSCEFSFAVLPTSPALLQGPVQRKAHRLLQIKLEMS